MKNQFSILRSKGVKVVAAASASYAAFSASVANAIDDSAITAAQAAGKASLELTTTGMIQIVAVVVAVGIVIAMLRKI